MEGNSDSVGSGTPAPSTAKVGPISLPKGGGAIRGIGDKLSVNAVNGTANLPVALPFSPGRAGFTPSFHVAYDSGAGNGPFGMGWRLDIPAITRRTDKGLPRYDDARESDIFILSDMEDLVPLLDADGTRAHVTRVVQGVTYEIFPYRPRVEGPYARVERWVCVATRRTHWRTISGDDVTTLYGVDANSCIESGEDPTQTFTYLMSRRFDAHGNLIVCSYIHDSGDGVDVRAPHESNRLCADRTRQRYLKSIRYGFSKPYLPDPAAEGREPGLPADYHFEMVFDYGEHDRHNPRAGEHGAWRERPDSFSNYRPGFEVRTYRRCVRALMFHHFPDEPGVGRDCLVRALEFRYDDEETPPDPTAPLYSLLISIKQVGFRRAHDGYASKSLPPLEFAYSKPVIDPTVRTLDDDSGANLPQGVDGTYFRFADLDAEGMPGILSDDTTAWRYQRNLSPLTGEPREDGTEPRVTAAFAPIGTIADVPSSHSLRGGIHLLDVAGEGRLDAVSFDPSLSGFWRREPLEGWNPLVAFRARISTDPGGPHVYTADLTGNGRADVLVGEGDRWTLYPSLGDEGYGSPLILHAPWNEEDGTVARFSTERESILFADMSGDGLADLVRIRNGELCFWPNLGYGRFGRKVIMDHSPWFATTDEFDPRRVRLADIDGSGTADVLYVGGDGVMVWFNRSGNSWSRPQKLAVFPSADLLSSVETADLLGNGTTCLVWSSPLPGQVRGPLRYVDLMSGKKPHLLIRTRNNIGAETRLYYAPSTRFYLEDLRAGIRWITRLPFAMQLIERVESYDWIGRSRFITRYAYHHGHYDGEDREFRGFGMVETWDTDSHQTNTAFPASENWDARSWSPPVHTKTWFHTGVFIGEGIVSRQFEQEYWIEPALRSSERRAEALAMQPSDSKVLGAVGGVEARDAHRALKGHTLRVETYSEDDSPQAALPYEVTEHNYQIRRLQPTGPNLYAVFAITERETLTFHYDRVAEDPRVSHDLVLEVDAYDHPLRTVSVNYPRRAGHTDPEPLLEPRVRTALAHDQGRQWVLGTQHAYTNPVFRADTHRLPEPSEVSTFELGGLQPGRRGIGIFTFEELDAAWRELSDGAHDIPYEDLSAADIDGVAAPAAGRTRRLLERLRTYYRSDDLARDLPLGRLESLALPANSYHLALTQSLIERVFEGRVGEPDLAEGGYVILQGSDGWWIPSQRVYFSAGDNDTPEQELQEARRHFFTVRRTIDAFGGVSRTDFDRYDLLPVRASDPVGNVHTAVNDYRVLEPSQVGDPNGNRAEVAFDSLGLVVGSAVRGKVTEDLGDNLDGFVPDLSDATIAAHLADPLADPLAVLGNASARVIYDPYAYLRTRDQPQRQAAVTYTIERETHVSDLEPGERTRFRHELAYSDGYGRVIQHKVQAEPGPLEPGGEWLSQRWVGSGWIINDNKGRPIRRFEPFFTASHRFEFNLRAGVSRLTFYDPVGRVVATLDPNNTWHKTIHGPWRDVTWDANDTVLISDPRKDPDVGDYFLRALGDDPAAFESWYDQRIGGQYGYDTADRAAERDAAEKAAAHAATPGVEHFDSAGRVCLSVTDLGTGGRQPLRTVHDAEGTQLATEDALGRRVVEYVLRESGTEGILYRAGRDLAGREIFLNQMDAGVRRSLSDVAGLPLRSWDARGHAVRLRYDANRRPTHRYVATDGAPEHLVGRTVYGEGMPDRNLCGQIYRHYDQSGLTSNDSCDFKGNLLDRSRQLAREFRVELDWSVLADTTDPAELDALAAPLLVAEDRFTGRSFYDALNRPVQAITPHSAAMQPNVVLVRYNEASKVDRVDVWEHVASKPVGLLDPATADVHAVTDITYNARGERLSITDGNGLITRQDFDLDTKRLVRIRSTRPNSFPADKRVVQDLHYTYDPSGNVTRTRDEGDLANQVFFRNRRVDPSSDYTYDAGYRLIRATGREHLGQNGSGLAGPVQPTNSDAPRVGLPSPGDGNAMATYVETYGYDAVGNLLEMFHQVCSGTWRRGYTYHEPSRIDPTVVGNRLSATTSPGDVHTQPHRGRIAYDAHGNSVRMPHLPSMTWNERDSLASTSQQVVNEGDPETTYYNYDGADQRVRKVTVHSSATPSGGTRRHERLSIGSMEIYREYGPDGTTVTLVRESLGIMAERKPVGVLEVRTLGGDRAPARILKYQYVNLIGSSSLELDDSASVLSYEEYFPFGSTSYQGVTSQTETPKRIRFSGKERDGENGLYYFGARYYAPWLGRWINPDPEGLVDGPNVYQYAHNNPIRVIDPDGTVGAILGGLTAADLLLGAFGVTIFSMGASQAMQKNPPRMPDWHPFAGNEEDWAPTPAPAPPIPIPIPTPAPPLTPVPAPPPPLPAPPIPVPAPPVPIPVPVPVPAPPVPVPVPDPAPGPTTTPIPVPVPIPVPIPIPLPVPGPRADKRTDTKKDPAPEPKPDPKKKPRLGPDPIPDTRTRRRRKKEPFRYVTYTKTKIVNGKKIVYAGRTAGYGDPWSIIAARDRNHHMKGYGPAQLDHSEVRTRPYGDRWNDPAYQRIRGREQQLIDSYGGAKKDPNRSPNSRSGNTIRGVRKDHPRGRDFDAAATRKYGRIAPYTGY